jgi:uracil-DNA glycosylase
MSEELTWNRVFQENNLLQELELLKQKVAEQRNFATVYPKDEDILRAFRLTEFNNVKVVIVGQDPYHGMGQANGLAFSVNPGIRIPPSLLNIFKEIQLEYKVPIPTEGDLSAWAKQGVFLINTILTVQENLPLSHQYLGWQKITHKVIELLSEKRKNLVFILWGNQAKQLEQFIDSEKHLILKSVHPSPLSVNRGFWNNQHFTQTNEYLINHGINAIEW